MTQPQNPITKAHLEGREMFREKFMAGIPILISKEFNEAALEGKFAHDLLAFLTTYGINLLKAAQEAGPKKDPVMLMQDGVSYDHYGVAGWNSCRSYFHQAIDEGIEGIRENKVT